MLLDLAYKGNKRLFDLLAEVLNLSSSVRVSVHSVVAEFYIIIIAQLFSLLCSVLDQLVIDVIDLVGGVDIDVSPDEVKYANYVITEMNTLVKDPAPLLTTGGTQTLSGVQAIGWSRIRYLDSDFVRTSRQRTVATALIAKVSEMNYLQQMALVEDSTGMFETNMQTLDLARVGLDGMGGAKNIEEYRLPEDNLYTVQDNPWMMIVDMDTQVERLHDFIWGGENE